MGLLDNILNMVSGKAKEAAKDAADKAKKAVENKSVTFTFQELPTGLEALKALPEASLDSEYKTAALTVLGLIAYADNEAEGIAMLNFLKAPNELSTYEKQFIKERLEDKKYVPMSYLGGTKPENDYAPAKPYTIKVSSNPYSYENEGYAVLWLKSSGADSPREIKLRKKKDGTWALWEQMILSDIRKPSSADPWA